MTTSRESARARLAEERRVQAERRRRRDRVVLAAVVAGVIVALAAIGLAVSSGLTGGGGSASALPRAVAGKGGGVAFGPRGAPVLDVYEDFQCPACGALERTSGPTLRAMANSGDMRVVFHPMSFLGVESDRASAAAGCAADAGRYLAFHRILFEHQPPEGTGGFTTGDLLALGDRAGIKGAGGRAFESCVRDGVYAGWADDLDARAGRAGVTGTPTVVLEGRRLTPAELAPAALRRALQQVDH